MLLDTILTPALFHLHSKDIENKQVVVIDILRATTTMVVVALSMSIKTTCLFSISLL
jgi:uracil phosphoribosyltransferase